MAEIIKLSESVKRTDDALAALGRNFAEEAKAVEIKIAAHLAAATPLVPEISSHIINAGGKRLRPLLTLSAARLCNYNGEHDITMATAVEFMHTATLLHDDVVDESDLRRAKPTARTLWGNQASILVGDFLLGQAFRMMVSAGSLTALGILSDAAAVIAEGEVMQLAALANPQISEDNYLRIIEAKTATLFAAAAEVGGVVAEADETARASLKSYGRNLGIAFQLVDDALDYGSLHQVLGKNTGEDFSEGKITLPLILAFHRGDDEERDFWKRACAGENSARDFERAVQLLHKHEALQDTINRAKHYSERAKDALGLFRTNELYPSLVRLAEFCISRAY